MGIQINGNNDIISALDGSWTAEGASINTSGILTATTFKGNIVGTAATFTGPVTIGGTLTYEDVTNIDSVGLITARGGIDCNGDLDVDGHTNLDNVSIVGVTTTSARLDVGNNGTNAVDLRFRTNRGSAGQTIANLNYEWNGTTVAQIRGIAGSDTTNKDDGHLAFFTTPAGSGSFNERLRIFSDGDVGIGTDTMVGDSKVHLWDGSTSNYRPIVIDSAATNGSTLVYRQLGTQVISIGSGGNNNLSGSSVTHGLIRSEVATVFAVGNSEKLRIDSSGHMSLGGGATPSSTNGGIGLKYGIKSAANNIIIGETTSSSHNGLILESRLTGRSGNARTSQINIGQDGTGGHIVFSTAAASADVTQRLKITRDGCVFASNFGIGTDSNWKIRANNSYTELAFEYATSSTLADTNIKAFFKANGSFVIKSDPLAAGGTMGDRGLVFQANSTPTDGQVIQGITFCPHSTVIGRARAGIAGVANANGGSHPQSGADLVFMTRYSADGHDLDVTTDEKMRIDTSGRVRIGNTTQNQYTAADDLIVGTGSGDRGLTLYSGGADAGVIAFSDGTSDTAYRSGQIIYDHSADAMDFRTNGNYIRLKLTSTGQVRIDGSTSANHGLRFTPGGWNGYDNRMGYCGTSGSDFWWSSNWNPTDGSRDHSGYATNYIRQSATGNGITFGTGDTNVSASERMKIMKDGKVGVNLTQPQTVLNVKGDISTGRNVAREVGTIINISSSYSGTRNGVSVINGQKNYEEDTNADWITANGQRANANLTIDLGSQYTCDRFVIYNQNEYANNVREVKRFTLEGSNDNSSWTTILDDEAGASYGHEPNPGWSFHMPANNFDDVEGVTYRYWKFTMKTYHGSTTLGGVMELELYEASNTNHSEITSHSVVATDIYARTIHHEAPAFFACRNSSFSIPNQSTTLVQFVDNQGPGFDTNNCWDNSNYRFVPNVPGYYSINMLCSVSYGSLQAGRIYIFKNGSSYAMSQLYLNGGDSYDDISMSCSTLVFLNGTGDYIDGRAWRNGGNGGLGDNETNQQISGFLARSAGPRAHGAGYA